MNNKNYKNLILFGMLVDVAGIILLVLTIINEIGGYSRTYYYIMSAALIVIGALIISYSAIMTYSDCLKNKKNTTKKKK